MNYPPVTSAYILNIGLAPSKRFPERAPLTEQEIRTTITNVIPGAYVRSYEVQQSASETTAVIRVSIDRAVTCPQDFYFIALNLSQDCIAVVSADIVECAPRRLPDQSLDGQLAGPYARDWGTFNASYFLLPAPVASDAYAGHLPDGSSVQVHSADEAYRMGIVMEAHEARGRKLWVAKKGDKVIFAHPFHNAARFAAMALLTGA